MTHSRMAHCAKWIAAGAFIATASATLGQPHEATRGELTLRSSTVASPRIDSATAERHGITRAPDVGVLNVLLTRAEAGRPRPIRAEVQAEAWSLSGVRERIEMREVRENDRVSYIGTYSFLPREVIDFRISARPLDKPAAAALSLAYRDRMWPR